MQGLVSHLPGSSLVLLSCLLTTAGCVIPKTVGGGSGTDTGSGTGSGTEGNSDPGPSSASTGTGTVPADSDSTGAETTDPGSTTQGDDETTGSVLESVCDPQPLGLSANVVLVDEDDEFFEFALDAPCEVVGLSPIANGQRIELSCDVEMVPTPYALDVLSSDEPVTVPLTVGQSVRARIFHTTTIDSGLERYIALSEPGGDLLLGFMWRWGIDRNGPMTAPWYAPLALEIVEGVCELEEPTLPVPMEGGSFIAEPCGYQAERLAFDVTAAARPVERIYDGRRETVGDYDVWVLGARRSYTLEGEPPCLDAGSPTPTVMVMMIAIP